LLHYVGNLKGTYIIKSSLELEYPSMGGGITAEEGPSLNRRNMHMHQVSMFHPAGGKRIPNLSSHNPSIGYVVEKCYYLPEQV
jgi:hypothetical protein